MFFHTKKKYELKGNKIKEIACLTENPSSWQMLEFGVCVEGLSGNIFDYEHISLELEFKSPSGRIFNHPAFFYRGYEFKEGRLLEPAPLNDGWRIRITPRESGDYSAVLRLIVDGIITDEISFGFAVTAGADQRGQIQVEPVNRKTFCFNNGTPYTAIGENVCWSGWDVRWPKEDSMTSTIYMEDIYRKLKDHNANWTRLWVSKYNSIHSLNSKPDDFYDGLGRAIITDRLLEAHAENDLYMDLVLLYHGMFIAEGNDKGWKECTFNKETNGGYLESPAEFFKSPRAKKDIKCYLRYMIARYGYSRNLFCWELFNEADSCEADPDDVIEWHKEMTDFIRINDCHEHMITTSACRNRSPLIFDDIYDFISMHRYGEPDNVKLIVHEAYMAATEFDRPILVAESGNSWRGPFLSRITRHQSVWTGIMGNTAGTAMNWWWDRVDEYEKEIGEPLSCYKDFAIAADFAKRIPRNAEKCRYVMRERLACNRPFTEAMGYKGKNFAYLWIYDVRYTRKNPLDETIETADFEVILENGEYNVEWVDSWTGDIILSERVEVKGSFAKFASPPFSRDILVAIEKV